METRRVHDLPPTAQLAATSAPTRRVWQPGPLLPVPAVRDQVIFVRGLPVAPWIPVRPANEVWAVWLERLRQLFAEWQTALPEQIEGASPFSASAPSLVAAEPEPAGWEGWRGAHVHILQARHAAEGVASLRALLERLARRGETAGEAPVAHLVGHSVGGAVILAYLAGLRAESYTAAAPVRAALTLDAAVAGLAGVWSGAKNHMRRTASDGLQGLGTWAAEQGIALLTATNERDVWSHRTLADLPYLGVRLGPAFSPLTVRHQVNGHVHGWLRRTPEFVATVWGPASA